MATKNANIIEIKPVEIMEIPVRIIGDTPLIMHRWSEKAKREILDKEQGKTKAAREIKRPVNDFCRSMYWMENGRARTQRTMKSWRPYRSDVSVSL